MVPIAIGSRALDLLFLLVKRSGDVVSKKEIMSAVWLGVVVEDSNLPTQILALRRVLDRYRQYGSCIQTVAGHGYRFVAAVTHPATDKPSVNSPADTDAELGDEGDEIRNKEPFRLEDTGEQNVKNIARPVRAYAIGPAEVAATPLVAVAAKPGSAHRTVLRRTLIPASFVVVVCIAIAAWWAWSDAGLSPVPVRTPTSPSMVDSVAAKPAPRLSIVVLPFANLSNDPEQGYFADAVTDDLTTDLSRISDSFVIARSTAFAYKGKPVDATQVGRELGVRYLLEGSVRRLGDEVQVNAQLIDATTGAHIWADRFDTDRTNLAKAQSEITALLARTLHLELMEAVGRQIEQEENPDARDLAMHGWALYFRPINKEQALAIQNTFERALVMDPQSVSAKIGIATVLLENVFKSWSKAPQQDQTRAEQLILEVFERDRNNPKALYAMGILRRQQARLAEARIAFEKTIALDRNHAGAMLQLGYTLNTLGEPERALPYFEKVLQLNPQHQNIFYFYSGLGQCHLLLGHADQAIDYLKKARASAPPISYISMFLAAALGLKGDIDKARAALDEFLQIRPELNSLAKIANIRANQNPKFVAIAEKTVDLGLRRAGLPEE